MSPILPPLITTDLQLFPSSHFKPHSSFRGLFPAPFYIYVHASEPVSALVDILVVLDGGCHSGDCCCKYERSGRLFLELACQSPNLVRRIEKARLDYRPSFDLVLSFFRQTKCVKAFGHKQGATNLPSRTRRLNPLT